MSQNYSAGTSMMHLGDQQTITVVAKNTGSATWTQSGGSPIKLGTWLPDRQVSLRLVIGKFNEASCITRNYCGSRPKWHLRV